MYGGGYMQQPYGMQPMYGGGYMQQPYGMQSMYGGYQQPYGQSMYGGYAQPYGQSMYGGYQQPYGQSMYGTGYPYGYSGYYGASTYTGISGFTSITSSVDADVELDSSDDGDEITVDEGDTISITLSAYHSYGYYYVLDDDDLDDDVIDFDTAYYCSTSSTEQWVFDAEGPGTTTIVLEYTSTTGATASTFEVEITVE